MPLEIYTYNDLDAFKYDILQLYPKIKFIDAEDFGEKNFILKQSKTLFNKEHYCFYEVNKISSDILCRLLENSSIDTVWGFSKLAKTSKFYKAIVTKVNIKVSTELKTVKEKISFIEKLLVKNNLPKRFVNILVLNTANDKFIIDSEVQKLKYAYAIDKNLADKIVSTYPADDLILKFVTTLLENPIEAYSILNRVCQVKNEYLLIEILKGLLLKKLKASIFLSIDNVQLARTYWNTSQYYLQKELELAKSIGFNRLTSIYKFCADTLSIDKYKVPLLVKLQSILLYIMENAYEDNSSRK